jgi:predicted nucleic acid-binding protein
MPDNSRPLFADTVTLSNFLGVEEWPFLVLRYGRRLSITPEVFTELAAAGLAERFPLETLLRAVQAGEVTYGASANIAAVDRTRAFRRSLGSGEASCLAHATLSGGVVATDDRAARRVCREEGIPVTGTIGILVAGVRDRTLSLPEAEQIHVRMTLNGFYSPVARIEDAV